jgi:hypothetical protein
LYGTNEASRILGFGTGFTTKGMTFQLAYGSEDSKRSSRNYKLFKSSVSYLARNQGKPFSASFGIAYQISDRTKSDKKINVFSVGAELFHNFYPKGFVFVPSISLAWNKIRYVEPGHNRSPNSNL